MSESQQNPGVVELPRPQQPEGPSPEAERSGAESQTAEPAPQRPRRRAGWVVACLLAAALVVCVLFLLQQVQRAERLQGEVSSLQTELSGARTRLALYESRMAEVRQSVSDLFGQVAGLREMVEERLPGEPGEAGAQPPEPARPEATEPPGATLPGAEGRPAARL